MCIVFDLFFYKGTQTQAARVFVFFLWDPGAGTRRRRGRPTCRSYETCVAGLVQEVKRNEWSFMVVTVYTTLFFFNDLLRISRISSVIF